MELLVSSVLIVMITLFLYNAIASMTLSNRTLAKHDDAEHNRSKIFDLLYRDLQESLHVKVEPTEDKHFAIVKLQTRNSLHEIAMPYVVYLIHTQNNALTRLEAAKEIVLPISYEDRFSVHADRLLEGVSDFNLYTATQEQNITAESNTTADANLSITNSVLLFLKVKNWSSPMLFELAL